MKKFTVLLVLILGIVSMGMAQTQKRVYLSSVPNQKLNSHADFVGFSNAATTSIYLPGSNNSQSITKPNIPNYLLIEDGERIVDFSDRDTSDTATVMVNINNPNEVNLTGIYDLPVRPIALQDGTRNVYGFAQFFDAFAPKGTLKIDSIAVSLFTFLKHVDGTPFPRVKENAVLVPYQTSKKLRTTAGAELSVSTSDFEQIGDEIEIPADDINNALTENGRTDVIIKITPPWEVTGNKMFGFILYPGDVTDTMRMLGTHMWGETDATKTLGYLAVHVDGKPDDFIYKQSNLIYPSSSNPNLAANYPSLVDVPLRINYLMGVTGIVTGASTSVETLSDEAKNFSLGQVTPNPVQNTSKITFSLQAPSTVSLRVVNSLGQVVNELANGAMNTGTYSADFDSTELPAGMYYYTLTAGTHSLTRSLVVVK